MELLPEQLRATLPPLYAQEKEIDKMVYVKLFTPWAGWTWYIIEGSPEDDDFILFGYVVGQFNEWGYSSLKELESIRGPGGLTIERDLYFAPKRMSQIHELEF